MRQLIIVIAASLSLSACAHFVRDGTPESQAKRDEAECDYEGAKATANGGSGFNEADVEIRCMGLRGYRLE